MKSAARPAVSGWSSPGSTPSARSDARRRHDAGCAWPPSSHTSSTTVALALLTAAAFGSSAAVPSSADHAKPSP
eukprot:196456-Pleurochrysis_carterae.AAC.1